MKTQLAAAGSWFRRQRQRRRGSDWRRTILSLERLDGRLCLDGVGFLNPPGSPFPAGEFPRSAVVADFNADGHLDVVTANQFGNDVTALKGTGRGELYVPDHFPLFQGVNSEPYAVAAGDFNGD